MWSTEEAINKNDTLTEEELKAIELIKSKGLESYL